MGSIEEITTPEMTFKEIPILDLSLARSEETKPEFLRQLRDCLLTVGFLYIKNTGIDQETYDRVCEEGIKFFDLPEEEKLAIEMKNAVCSSEDSQFGRRQGLRSLTYSPASLDTIALGPK